MQYKGTVAIVINTSWNVYNFRLNLLRALQKEGYRIVVIAPFDPYTQKLKEEGFECRHLLLDNDSTNTFKELKLFADLWRHYHSIRPDIILHYTIKPNIYGTLAAAFLHIPTINNISGLGTVFLNNRFSSLIARGLYRVTLHLSGRVFFQNLYDMQLFKENKIVSKDIVELIPGSGIDTEKFAPRGAEPKRMTFLFIGRLIRDKGIEEYIEAIRIVRRVYPDALFQIVGSLYEKNPTAVSRKRLQEWRDQRLIEYLGHTDDIRTVIAGASCVVLPSYREGLSRSLLEGASMARPIIATDVPGCRDVVDDGVNGFLCRVRDPEDLAEKMIEIAALSPEARQKMGEQGRKKVLREFGDRIIIEKYKETITSLLSD